MKKTYITPLMSVENLAMEEMLASSYNLYQDKNTQDIILTDEEYDGEFSAKGNFFGESVFD